MPRPQVLDSYEIVHHLYSALKTIRSQLDGTGRYIVDAACYVADDWMCDDDEDDITPSNTKPDPNAPCIKGWADKYTEEQGLNQKEQPDG